MENETKGQATPVEGTQKVVEEQTSEKKEQTKTLSDIAEVETTEGIKESKKSDNSVFKQMISFKKESREQKNIIKDQAEKIKELESRKESYSKPDYDKKVKAFADKHGIEEDLVNDLVGLVKKDDNDELLLSAVEKINLFEEKETMAKINSAIDKEFSRVVSENPEFKEFANKEAIKSYVSSNPYNAKKSMDDIFQELYGNIINKDNKSIEGYSPSNDGKIKEYDFGNLTPQEFKEVKSNPELKKKYDAFLVSALKNN
jgi:hypothetical protein